MNPQIAIAQEFLQKTGMNIFLTGKAGTGKTTFLKNLKDTSLKRMIVVAPTGVAAINAGGVTIHSFFQLPFGPYIPGIGNDNSRRSNGSSQNRFSKEKINIMRSLDLLIIDEISMVRADLLDAVSDTLCRFRKCRKPFGGVQLLFIGDMQQLAPVAKDEEWTLLKEHYTSPYFFDSKAFKECKYYPIELMHVYRQEDGGFLQMLNNIRENRMDSNTLQILNKRYSPDFNPSDDEGYITLTTHNYMAQNINKRKLDEIKDTAYSFTAEIKDEFPEYLYPTDLKLTLKKGAQVMFVKNDSSPEKEYYNGKIGKITDIGKDRITVTDKDGLDIEVHLEIWDNTKYTIDPETKEITENIIGAFVQYPLKTAWAITIHKSQGLTFEHAIIDAASAFSHGQVYVALSRCKTLEGLVLSSPIGQEALINDNRINEFTKQTTANQPDIKQLEEAQKNYYTELITELFDFKQIQTHLQYATNALFTHVQQLYPALCSQYAESRTNFNNNITIIGEKFQQQLSQIISSSPDYENNTTIQERVRKGVVYFMEQIGKYGIPLPDSSDIEIDNKETRKIITREIDEFKDLLLQKINQITACRNGFNTTNYLKAKAKSTLENDEKPTKRKKQKNKTSITEKTEISSDILNPTLYNALRLWRNETSKEKNVPAYVILSQKALLAIANTSPKTPEELIILPGVGAKTVEKYGDIILEIVSN